MSLNTFVSLHLYVIMYNVHLESPPFLKMQMILHTTIAANEFAFLVYDLSEQFPYFPDFFSLHICNPNATNLMIKLYIFIEGHFCKSYWHNSTFFDIFPQDVTVSSYKEYMTD